MRQNNLLPGVFTVNKSGKKVRFSKGNLFWNGSEFALEENQLAYPTDWNPNHVGHFYWSKYVDVAPAARYCDPDMSKTDTLFAADGRAIVGLTVLSADEWKYVLEHSLYSQGGKYEITVAGKKGAVLKPDGFTGSVKAAYTLDEWREAEDEGLVFLPFAGGRLGTDLACADDCVGLLSSSCLRADEYYAFEAYVIDSDYGVNRCIRANAFSVRLVELI